jgi:hypothetical protein
MVKLKVGLLVLVGLLISAASAKADGTTFDLTASGVGTNISLVMTGTAVSGSPGVFDITGLSGTVDGLSATLLATSGPGMVTTTTAVNGWLIEYDNVLNMNGPYLDLYGLGFLLSNGALGNLYYSGGYLYAQLGNNPPNQEQVNVSVVDPPGVTAPEPGSLALLMAGLLAVCLFALRK